MIDQVFLSHVGNKTGKIFRFPLIIPHHPAAAPQPAPFSENVSGPVFNIMVLHSAVGNILVTLQESLFIFGMDKYAPYGGSILHDLTGQPEFFHHGRGIPEYACLHISDKHIIISTGSQSFIKELPVVIKTGSCPAPLRIVAQPHPRPVNVEIPLLDVHPFIGPGYNLINGKLVARINCRYPITERSIVIYPELLPLFLQKFQRFLHPFGRPVFRFIIKSENKFILAQPEKQVRLRQPLFNNFRYV